MPVDRLLDLLDLDAGRAFPARDAIEHALHQIVVVLVAIGLEVEVGRHLGQPLVADVLDVVLHEAVVGVPADAGRAHRRLLGARGDLMGVQVMQVELIDQRLLHLLVQDEIAVGVDVAAVIAERRRHVTVDIDGLAVLAVAGEVGDVVLAIEALDPAHDGIERAVHHQGRDVPFGNFQLLVRRVGMAKVERHSGISSNRSPASIITRPVSKSSRAPLWQVKNRCRSLRDRCHDLCQSKPAPRGALRDLEPSAGIAGSALSEAPRSLFEHAPAVNNPAFCEAIFGPFFSPCRTFKFVDESIY